MRMHILIGALLAAAMAPPASMDPGAGGSRAAVVPATSPVPILPLAADREVCALATESQPDGDLGLPAWLVRNLVADVDKDGRPDRLVVEDQGTMRVGQLRLTFAGGAESWPELSSEAKETDEAPFALGQRLLAYGGEVYLLHFAGREPLYLMLVSRVLPDGNLLPLCRFAPNVSVDWSWSEDAGEAQASLCEAFQRGLFRPVPETGFARPRRTKTDILAGDALLTAAVTVDFANDRRPARLVRAEASSGAGPGCDTIEYRLAGASSARSRHLLEDLQSRGLLGPGFLGGSCRDDKVRWLRYRGRSYLEVAARGSEKPEYEESEYHFLSTVEGDRAHRVCEASFYHLPPVPNGFWDGTKWVAAAAETVSGR